MRGIHTAWGVLLVLALAGLAPVVGAHVVASPPVALGSGSGAHPTPTWRPPPGLGLAFGPGARPLLSSQYYTQEGATIEQLNGTPTTGGVETMTLQLTLKTSPYPIGYELNGLSNTGDWYQVVVADNWPGCSSGFEEVTEVWDSSASSGPVNCDSTLSLSANDVVVLGLNFTSGGNVCLDVHDLTTTATHSVCQVQPDTGADQFVTVQGIANSNGYYTGPMTEIVNTTATTCPSYTNLPPIDYRGPSGTWVTQYAPWSDEFDVASVTLCYSGGGNGITLAPGDVTTHYTDTAAGSGYASRWGAGQNLSFFNSAFGWRFETDPSPVSTTLTADRTDVLPGTTVHLSAQVSGGVGPYSGLWYVNGSLQLTNALTFNYTPAAEGTVPITAVGVDSQSNARASTPLTIISTGPLTVLSLTSNPSSGGIDVGQSVTFFVSVDGGLGPRTFNWSGLPPGCPAVNSSLIPCTPRGPGLYQISVNVTDSNHTRVLSPTLNFTVHPAPVATLSANATEVDVGQTTRLEVNITGGIGPFVYSWSAMPSGCPSADVSVIVCVPTQSGSYPVQVTATDANGVLVLSDTLLVIVHASPAVVLTTTVSSLEVGLSTRLTAAASGGAGTFAYTWSGLPAGCTGQNASTLTCAPTASGSSVVKVTVQDRLGGRATSSGLLVTTYPALAVTLHVVPAQVHVGDVVTFTADVTGGHGTLHYEWDGLPTICATPPTNTFGCQVASSGSFTITVIVSDGLGVSANATTPLTVTGGSTSPGFLGLGTTGVVLVGLGIAVVAIAAGIAVARRRRVRSAAEPEDEAPSEY